jgi:coproporphyrinogen III oxidase
VASLMRGRFFEKAGVHVSTVHGVFGSDFAAQVKGAEKDPRFWASGVSLIAHPRNPHCPAAHMNLRCVATTESWFGGGGDLTPTQSYQRSQDFEDARDFHGAMKAACDRHGPDYHARFKAWCDEYFWLKHRGEPRGVGGIFFDHHNSGGADSDSWDADFAFAREVGAAFLEIYPALLTKRMGQAWSDAEREEQLVQRGRYVEFNLLYDRGTLFGLKTGGNIEAILSSMPPVVTGP